MFYDDIYIDDFQKPLHAINNNRSRHRPSVCSIEHVDSIFNGRGLLSVAVAGIYRIEYSDGSNNEILVHGDQAQRDFDSAYFLERGRSSDQLSEVLKLIVKGAAGIVPEYLKRLLAQHEIGLNCQNKIQYKS